MTDSCACQDSYFHGSGVADIYWTEEDSVKDDGQIDLCICYACHSRGPGSYE